MIRYDPAQRISAKRLLKSPYFKDIDKTKVVKTTDEELELSLFPFLRPM